MLHFLVLYLFFVPVLAKDKLVFVQTLWRHGDRIPKQTYPSDPYQKDFWGMPWGEITQDGVNHLFLQGQNLRKLYVDTGFLEASYNSDEITLQTAYNNKCTQSGMAMMAGFYADSPLSLTVPSWPTGWYPVPLHSTPKDDKMLDIECKAANKIQKKREKTPLFQDFLASNWNLFALLSQNGGQGDVDIDYKIIKDWATTVKEEKEFFNLTLPSWITDDVYNQLQQAYLDGHDFLDGLAGFGFDQDDKLLKLRGGFLLHDWRTNLKDATTSKKLKYHGYSAHDHTMTALLNTLGAKQALLGPDIPQYGATLICEMWKRDGDYFVKFLFLENHTSPARVITPLLTACPANDDFCPFQQFYDATDKYSTQNEEDCDA